MNGDKPVRAAGLKGIDFGGFLPGPGARSSPMGAGVPDSLVLSAGGFPRLCPYARFAGFANRQGPGLVHTPIMQPLSTCLFQTSFQQARLPRLCPHASSQTMSAFLIRPFDLYARQQVTFPAAGWTLIDRGERGKGIKSKDPMWKHGDFGIWYDIVPLVMSCKYRVCS